MCIQLDPVKESAISSLVSSCALKVPTMAIEQVYIMMNSSIIHDEVLAHRLGLVPINIDPRMMEWKGEDDGLDEGNTILFNLDVTCPDFPEGTPNRTPLPGGGLMRPTTMPVYSRHLEWVPQGDQEERFGVNGVRPKHEDILLAKLRPGQVTTADCLCRVRSGCQAHHPHFQHFTNTTTEYQARGFL
jgi:DNA-directed RNA polymerases I and III subunit RPAC1